MYYWAPTQPFPNHIWYDSAILCFNLVRPREVFVEVGGSAFEGFEGVGGDDGAEVGPGEEVEFGVGGGEDLEVGGC